MRIWLPKFMRLLLLPWLASMLSACALFQPLPEPSSQQQRLAAFANLPPPAFDKPVTIYWNDYKIPYIQAETDRDAALALGLVHAHLRLGQMEVGKRIAQGRLSEIAGPFTTDIDAGLRALGLGRANAAVLANMSAATRDWLTAYVAGINHYKDALVRLPHDMRVLNMQNEPWRIEDSLALGRLTGIDINWGVMLALLPEVDKPSWPEFWARVKASQKDTQASFQAPASKLNNTPVKASFNQQLPTNPGQLRANQSGKPKQKSPPTGQNKKLALLKTILGAYARAGSNSFAISGAKSVHGAPIIANDPHLGFLLPNVWIIAGLQSPSYQVVGMMPMGVPIFGFGRTQHIAWGGTNMRQEASDLVDVSHLRDEFLSENHRIKRRLLWDSSVQNRLHPKYGPIVSDLDILPFPEGRDIALRWTGHLSSNEITAMLAVLKAKNWQEFRQAAAGFSLPGQNFIFATSAGDIGQVSATWVPKRPAGFPETLFVTPTQSDAYWSKILNAQQLPAIINPSSGVIASANNKPFSGAAMRVGYYYASDDRIRRLYEVLTEDKKFSLADIKLLQLDSFSISQLALRDHIQASAQRYSLTQAQNAALQALAKWDGYFAADSRAAYLHHLFYVRLYQSLYKEFPDFGDPSLYRRSGLLAKMLPQDLQAIAAEDKQRLIKYALDQVAEALKDDIRWGDIHVLNVQHALGNIPLLGSRYKIAELRAPGHDSTLLKTAGNLSTDKHRVSFGAQSRHLSDLSDPDANYFVLFGGQDGEINSENFADQIPLWQQGRYIQVPLNLAKAKETFRRITQFNGSLSK